MLMDFCEDIFFFNDRKRHTAAEMWRTQDWRSKKTRETEVVQSSSIVRYKQVTL